MEALWTINSISSPSLLLEDEGKGGNFQASNHDLIFLVTGFPSDQDPNKSCLTRTKDIPIT